MTRQTRPAVIRHYVRTHEEIAAIVGTTVSNVCKTEARALRKLRELVAADEFFVSGVGLANERFNELAISFSVIADRAELQDGI